MQNIRRRKTSTFPHIVGELSNIRALTTKGSPERLPDNEFSSNTEDIAKSHAVISNPSQSSRNSRHISGMFGTCFGYVVGPKRVGVAATPPFRTRSFTTPRILRRRSVSTTQRRYIKDVPQNALEAMKLLEDLCNLMQLLTSRICLSD